MALVVRKVVVQIEETLREAGREVEPSRRRTVAAAVITNPLAGRYVDDLAELVDLGAEVGGLLAARAVAALGCAPDDVVAYGKAAIVGTDGELEHAAALLHPRFGGPVRAAVDHGHAIIPSTKKVAGVGATITVPITNKDDIWSFDEMDAAEISIPDAPRADEVVVVLAVALGGRPLARVTKPA
jgi:Amino acid synthesis